MSTVPHRLLLNSHRAAEEQALQKQLSAHVVLPRYDVLQRREVTEQPYTLKRARHARGSDAMRGPRVNGDSV